MPEVPAIAYIGHRDIVPLRCRRLDGIRRFAWSRSWRVETISPDAMADRKALRARLAEMRAVGAVVECHQVPGLLPPSFFRRMPVVYFDPPDSVDWRGAATVSCDEGAVAQAAFRELSTGLPPSFAVVSHFPARWSKWARDRIAAFMAACAGAGRPCAAFPERRGEGEGGRHARLVSWAAALPDHCAVFAIDDYCAAEVARAFAAARRPIPKSATLLGADGAESAAGDASSQEISSVKIDFELSGYLAARMLDEKIAGTAHAAPTFGPMMVARGKSTRGHGRREQFVLEAVETIRREACDGLTAASLIARFPVSKRLFNLRFREAMGHSPLDEIMQVRMEKVLSLLSGTDTPVGAIADMCGFGSAVELRQIFRARTGISMTEWRARRA